MFEALLVAADFVALSLYRRADRKRIAAECELEDAMVCIAAQDAVMRRMLADLEAAGVVKETRLVLPKRVWS
jgi:hypothetical protein